MNGPSVEGPWPALSPLRLRLMGFALVCALPAMLLPILRAQDDEVRVRLQATATAEAAAALLEARLRQVLSGAEDVASLMASLDLRTEHARRSCSSGLSSAPRAAATDFLNFLALDEAGDVICSALPLAGATNARDRPHVQDALRGAMPVISGYVVGRIARQGAIHVVVPRKGGADDTFQLGVASIHAHGLSQGIPGDGTIPVTLTVFDGSGLLVSRSSAEPTLLHGADLSGTELFSAARALQPASAVGLDGRSREYVFRRIDFHGKPALWVASGVDAEVMQTALDDARRRETLWVSLVSAAVILLAAFAGGPLVLARFRGMRVVARQISAGSTGARIRLKWRDELRPIEDAFNGMLDSLEAERSRLAESEMRFRMLYEHNLDGVLVTEPTGNVLAANQAACEILGRSEEELKRLGRAGLVDRSDPRLAPLLEQRTKAGWAKGEIRFVKPDGSTVETEIASSIYRYPGGRVETNTVIRDLSELHAARTHLLRLNSNLEYLVEQRTSELAGAVKELEAFAYTVSHDLRAPLSTIDGFANVLLKNFGGNLPQNALHYLERIRAGAQKLGVLVDSLLTLSRFGREVLRERDCDMHGIVQEVLEEAAAAHPKWDGGVQVGTLPTCRADPVLVRQLWANLIGNAYKYTSRTARPWIEVGWERLETGHVFYVRDNGAGFDMAYSDKLFDVFHRLHLDSEFEGTGVGLAIVKRIVDKHGGRVWATAAVGKGATFYFTLGNGETV